MYFSKITLKPTADRAKYAETVCANTYKEHQELWKLFNDDPDADRDFIYRYEPQNNIPAYYVVSNRKPNDQTYLWDIQTKDYQPKLAIGEKYAFILRVNPVISKKGRRHDVVMHKKYLMNYKKIDKLKRPTSQQIIEEAGREWLQSRVESAGFSFDNESVRIDGYQAKTSGKKRGNKEIRYSTMDYRGILSITNPDAFSKVLMQGIGKARAFGCGLMLIRRL